MSLVALIFLFLSVGVTGNMSFTDCVEVLFMGIGLWFPYLPLIVLCSRWKMLHVQRNVCISKVGV